MEMLYLKISLNQIKHIFQWIVKSFEDIFKWIMDVIFEDILKSLSDVWRYL